MLCDEWCIGRMDYVHFALAGRDSSAIVISPILTSAAAAPEEDREMSGAVTRRFMTVRWLGKLVLRKFAMHGALKIVLRDCTVWRDGRAVEEEHPNRRLRRLPNANAGWVRQHDAGVASNTRVRARAAGYLVA